MAMTRSAISSVNCLIDIRIILGFCECGSVECFIVTYDFHMGQGGHFFFGELTETLNGDVVEIHPKG